MMQRLRGAGITRLKNLHIIYRGQCPLPGMSAPRKHYPSVRSASARLAGRLSKTICLQVPFYTAR